MENERNENEFSGSAGGKAEKDGKAAEETGEEAIKKNGAGERKKTCAKNAAKDRRGELLSALPLLLGIISMIYIFINSQVGIIFAIGGIILGFFVRNRCPAARNLIFAGIVCSAAGVVLGAFSMIFKLWVIGEMLTFFS